MSIRSLSNWEPQAGTEPFIRVGVVLPTDQMTALQIDVPDRLYHVFVDQVRSDPLPPGSARLRVDSGAVMLESPAGARQRAEVVRLVPAGSARPRQSSGIRLNEVVTGRGFHWQKRVSFSLEGVLEFRACDGFLLAANELGLEDYLQGVITAEMSGACPLEFLKSQCVVARSWALAHSEPKHTAWPIDRCNDDCCQRYHGTSYLTSRAMEAVASTRGQVVTDAAGGIIDANYSKNCGGLIEAPEHVWFTSKACQRSAVDAPVGSAARRFLPVTEHNLEDYLTGSWLEHTDVFCSPNVVPDAQLPGYLGSVDEGGGHFRWRVEYRREELEDLLRRKLKHVFSDNAECASPGRVLVADLPPRIVPCRLPLLEQVRDLRVCRRGSSGRASEIEIECACGAGQAVYHLAVRSEYRIREVLHEKFLYSSAFKAEFDRDHRGVIRRVTLCGAGWGHGAGLCQIGALGMAVKGYRCLEILQHYFEGVALQALY